MNIQHLRRALKSEWLNYYRQNRHWIVRLGVWVNCQGERRPSASFILGVLSTLEPQLVQLLPLVVDLNSSPDRIVMALGLNFNPEDQLEALAVAELPPMQAPRQAPRQAPVQQPAPPNLSPTPEQSTLQENPAAPDQKKRLPSSTTPPVELIERLPNQPNRRTPLDTAQLRARELPNRSITRTYRGERDRKKTQWD